VSHANTPTALPPASQPPATLAAWQNYEGSAGKIVTSARLNDSLNGAEMHVALRSASLGPMEIRAVVHEGSVGAEIHVEGREAHSLLAASLPSLERALGERDLRVGNLAVYQDHVGGGMSGGGEQNPHSGSSPSPQRQVLPWDTLSQPGNQAGGTDEILEVVNPAAGLSVRA
jgi:flagellar hook-length control protein FliK